MENKNLYISKHIAKKGEFSTSYYPKHEVILEQPWHLTWLESLIAGDEVQINEGFVGNHSSFTTFMCLKGVVTHVAIDGTIKVKRSFDGKEITFSHLGHVVFPEPQPTSFNTRTRSNFQIIFPYQKSQVDGFKAIRKSWMAWDTMRTATNAQYKSGESKVPVNEDEDQ